MKYVLLPLLFLTACGPTYYCCDGEPSTNLTTGLVQREIRIGMPASDVATALGSPNIVSLDENRDEVWVYDKVSSEVEYCSSRGGFWIVIAGKGSEHGHTKRSQRTLTVIVKFDQDKRVKDFTYHSSKF